jgi:septum formation protein
VSEFIYLASQSPRRRQLLEQLGVRYELLLPDADEDAEGIEAVLPGEAPARYVQRVTGLKLDAAMARLKRRKLPVAPILCSDTTVALGRTIYGKPEDAADARRMLRELSGATHRVLTAVAVQHGRKRLAALSTSRVTFAPMTPAADPPLCGQWRADGQGGRLRHPGRGGCACFVAVSGSYSGIMGLPMYETAQLLRDAAGHPHQLVAPGNPRGRGGKRRGAGAARRAHAGARPGGQHVPGQGGARAAGHAVGVHRHRAGARGLPACGRCLAPPARRRAGPPVKATQPLVPIEKQVFEGQA